MPALASVSRTTRVTSAAAWSGASRVRTANESRPSARSRCQSGASPSRSCILSMVR